MEYIKGKPYFCEVEERIKQYPYLDKNIECEILIVGGGIDGTIANHFLSINHDVVLVDKSRFGMGCTSVATALLEYQLDEFASDLKKYMTKKEIVFAYTLGKKSIQKIENFVKKYGNFCNFSKKTTFLFAKQKSQRQEILQEYEFRKKNGFKCDFVEKGEIFPFEFDCGILANDGGAEFNPYLFTKQMIETSKNQNQIFENTKIENISKMGDKIVASTNFGEKIFCKKLVVATGFNWEFLKKTDLCERFISYSIVTEPIENFDWHKQALIHDCQEPYHYLRILPDKRIILGGEDTVFNQKPISEKTANKKYGKLQKDLFEMFPKIKNCKIEYKFCGTFGTTKNNMGLIGKSDFDDDVLLFVSCGANGIINAMIGVEVLEDLLQNKQNKYSGLFSPKRSNI